MYVYKVKQLVKVVDGDTIDVIIDLGFNILKKERVRVAGIDAPEKRTRDAEEKVLGWAATEWMITRLNNLKLDGKELVIKTEKDGKYGRMLGWLYEQDKSEDPVEWLSNIRSINMEMVEEGYAWEYDGKAKNKDLEALRVIRRARGSLSE